MITKSVPPLLFEAKLNWLSGDRGILHGHGINGPVYVSTPSEFGGSGKEWSPEHLFLSSIISCYMSTFLSFTDKMHLVITHFECSAIGQIELVAGKYKFTRVDIYPKVYMADASLHEKAGTATQKTQQYCLVSNSVNAEIIYHSELLTDAHPLHIDKKNSEEKLFAQ
jgi:organic hydroperoxide reductase OsmC/OhrA